MLRWHHEHCTQPEVHLSGEFVYCLACQTRRLQQFEHPRRLTLQVDPSPSDDRRSCMDLTWPSSVQYSTECIVGARRGDLGDTLRSHLGRTPRVAQSNALQDEKADLGFPPLPSDRHIRVLHITPANREDEPLHGLLEVQDLDGNHFYEALSYTWMDENDDATLTDWLYLGAEWDVLHITKSCSRALRRLRLQGSCRPIWIDSICINQLNNVEKSHQIALMRTIYANSIRCVVDIGEHAAEADMAIQYIMSARNGEGLDDAKPKSAEEGIRNLFRRKYFSRIWIIQELVYAPQVIITYGSRPVDWRLLADSVSDIPALDWMQKLKDSMADGRPANTYAGAVGLFQLLNDTVNSNSSDPRDKVFALIGLVRGLERAGITADYDLIYTQVCTGLAAYFVQHLGLTRIILLRADVDANLPSWVPNWAALRQSDWIKATRSPQDASFSSNDLLEKAITVLVNSSKLSKFRDPVFNERFCRFSNNNTINSDHRLYKPEVHGLTGTLIHQASCLFSFQGPEIRKMSSMLYTKDIWIAGEREIVQYVVATEIPVIEDKDIVACFLEQQRFIHLRRGSNATYRI
ncbi:heterokaryon incompatibility protein-domain-containing protein [Astrocystis sublimbata]|nr:heterokaryon incompatibility protein-domain-containing protein [Astrocystis sublimbata]